MSSASHSHRPTIHTCPEYTNTCTPPPPTLRLDPLPERSSDIANWRRGGEILSRSLDDSKLAVNSDRYWSTFQCENSAKHKPLCSFDVLGYKRKYSNDARSTVEMDSLEIRRADKMQQNDDQRSLSNRPSSSTSNYMSKNINPRQHHSTAKYGTHCTCVCMWLYCVHKYYIIYYDSNYG